MAARALLQTSSQDSVEAFWSNFMPAEPVELQADAVAGFIIVFVIMFFIIGCMICKMTGTAHQVRELENRMHAMESFAESMKKDDD
mmetsp:Transcript_4167/g.7063  ORF Transcript_4167/g.7063 Transcript_4167/m.7063 type:complete len:86 (-) Transcript_4167:282-539(-)|eukprot:CAMPEP_0168625348 /NCGR_PEP_ID=MMETSP0449_2-20121227/9947_1 /TAXON_ID=1082188 /ORGANISM="Strombidium rassoulzadegani, Strain ras09" /LENGTH=85 /DNA_ID=CAMNT_0008667063 /DNA_START=72 /DNA_END=329 /DNA_ORIENTATION=+